MGKSDDLLFKKRAPIKELHITLVLKYKFSITGLSLGVDDFWKRLTAPQ